MITQFSTPLKTAQQQNASRAFLFSLLPFEGMSRIENRQKTRRENFAKLRAERFKTSTSLADALGEGFSSSYISQLLGGHRGIGDEVADKIEKRLGLPTGYLDREDAEPAAMPVAVPFYADLAESWKYLLPAEQSELLEDIKKRAEHNKAVMNQLSPPEVTKRTVSVADRRLRQANHLPFADRRKKNATQ